MAIGWTCSGLAPTKAEAGPAYSGGHGKPRRRNVILKATAALLSGVAKDPTMQMLYDSDSFVVVHMQANEAADGEPPPRIVRHGFEIVDKRTNKEVYLDGTWAEAFQRQ